MKVSVHERWMRVALQEAARTKALGEIPIGAALVLNQKLIAAAHNRREASKNPLHHAEILALEGASQILGDWRFKNATLYVTVEPCPMCLGALLQARIGGIVFGCLDPKRKPISLIQKADTQFEFPNLEQIRKIRGNNHTLSVHGPVLEQECAGLLQEFFKSRRTDKKNGMSCNGL